MEDTIMREILKKKITKSEVVQMHRDKWNWIADYIEKENPDNLSVG
jgi:hypothetical protein